MSKAATVPSGPTIPANNSVKPPAPDPAPAPGCQGKCSVNRLSASKRRLRKCRLAAALKDHTRRGRFRRGRDPQRSHARRVRAPDVHALHWSLLSSRFHFLFAQLTKGQATETVKLAYGGPKVGSVKLSDLKQQGYNR